MKIHHVALVCALALQACSGDAPLPSFDAVKQAGLDHVNCVNRAAIALARTTGKSRDLAPRAVNRCAVSRARAIAMKAVPVMWGSAAELDRESLDVATTTIEDARAEAAGDLPEARKIRAVRQKLPVTFGKAA